MTEMPALSIRTHFGRAASSLETTRRSVELPRPISLRQVADSFGRDIVFDEDIVTKDGVALGGHQRLTLRHGGQFLYEGHFRATGFPSFDVSIVTTLRYTVPSPDGSAPLSAEIALADTGSVAGFNSPGSREFRWSQTGTNPIIRSYWPEIRGGHFQRQLQFDTDWFGPTGDALSLLGQVVAAGATFGAGGVALVLAGTMRDSVNFDSLILPGTVGILAMKGAGYILGRAAMFPAFVLGAVVAATTVRQRPMTEVERHFADEVFHGHVPYDRVLLTNLVGFRDRPFTTPLAGGTILVNIGTAFDDPIHSTTKGGTEQGRNAPGQLLIHELTHAWQIANESFMPEFYCRAVSTSVGTMDGDYSAYRYGAAGSAWGSFGTEQQASIVDEWFAGSKNPDDSSPQYKYPPKHSDQSTTEANPYFRYIRDNIRSGIV